MKEILVEIIRTVCILGLAFIFINNRHEKEATIFPADASENAFCYGTLPHPPQSNKIVPLVLPFPSSSHYSLDDKSEMLPGIPKEKVKGENFLFTEQSDRERPLSPEIPGKSEYEDYIQLDDPIIDPVVDSLNRRIGLMESEAASGFLAGMPYIVTVIPLSSFALELLSYHSLHHCH